jgi:hypothetical protein
VGTLQPFSLAGLYKRARGCETSIMGGRMVPFPNHGISGGRATNIILSCDEHCCGGMSSKKLSDHPTFGLSQHD